MYITESTKLSDLKIPHLKMLIEEKFNIPCWQQGKSPYPVPNTVGDLASATDSDPSRIIKRIASLIRMVQTIELSMDELGDPNSLAGDFLLLDIRPSWSLDSNFIAGSRFLSAEDPGALVNEVKRAGKVLLVCDKGFRSFSGALYLRELGQSKAFCLKGGIKSLNLNRA